MVAPSAAVSVWNRFEQDKAVGAIFEVSKHSKLPWLGMPSGQFIKLLGNPGVEARLPGDQDHQPKALIKAADTALYRANPFGRDRVCAAT